MASIKNLSWKELKPRLCIQTPDTYKVGPFSSVPYCTYLAQIVLIYSTTPQKVVSQLHIDRNRNREDCADPKHTTVKGGIPTNFSPLHQSNSSGALLQADLLPGVVDQFRAEIAEFRDEPLFYFCFFP